jgi:hypothetical protein
MHTCFLNIHGVCLKLKATQEENTRRIANLCRLFILPDQSNSDMAYECTDIDEDKLLSILARNDMFAFHAAAYENKNMKGILLPGKSSSGKTSIAFSALKKGYPFTGDDVVLCRYNGGTFSLLPFKSYLHIKRNGESQKYDILEHHTMDIFCQTNAEAIVFPHITMADATSIKEIKEKKIKLSSLLQTSVWVSDKFIRNKHISMLKEMCKLPAYDLFLGPDQKLRPDLAIEILDGI